MRLKNLILICILLVPTGNNILVTISAHVGDPHTEENDTSSTISIRLFLIVNMVIISLSLGLVFLVNQYQQNIKYISLKTMIIVIISTLFVNAIVAVNTYVEVE